MKKQNPAPTVKVPSVQKDNKFAHDKTADTESTSTAYPKKRNKFRAPLAKNDSDDEPAPLIEDPIVSSIYGNKSVSN